MTISDILSNIQISPKVQIINNELVIGYYTPFKHTFLHYNKIIKFGIPINFQQQNYYYQRAFIEEKKDKWYSEYGRDHTLFDLTVAIENKQSIELVKVIGAQYNLLTSMQVDPHQSMDDPMLISEEAITQSKKRSIEHITDPEYIANKHLHLEINSDDSAELPLTGITDNPLYTSGH